MSADTHSHTSGADAGDDLADVGLDTPRHAKVQALRTEDEVLLKNLLHIDIALGHKHVAKQIFEVMKSVRKDIKAEEEEVLDKKVEAIIHRIDHAGHGGEHHHGPDDQLEKHLLKVREIANFVRESVPPEALYNLFKTRAEILDADATVPAGYLRREIDFPAGGVITGKRKVTVNLNHPWWKGKTFKRNADLIAQLTAQELRNVGITISGYSGRTSLDAQSALIISDAPFENTPYEQGYGILQESFSVGSGKEMFMVDIDALATAKTNDHAPSVTVRGGATKELKNIRIGSLTQNEMEAILGFEYPSGSNNFPYWNMLVKGIGTTNPKNDVPGITPAIPYNEYFAKKIFEYVGRDPRQRLIGGPMRLKKVQDSINLGKDLQTKKSLYENSENPVGAAVAFSLLQQNSDLGDVLKSHHNEPDLKKKIEEMRLKRDLVDQLGKVPSSLAVTATIALDKANAILGQVGAAKTALAPATGTEMLTIDGESYGPVDLSKSSEKKKANDWINQHEKSAKAAKSEYQKIAAQIGHIAALVVQLKEKLGLGTSAPPEILNMFVFTGTPARVSDINGASWHPSMNVNGLIAEVRNFSDFDLKDAAKYQEDLAKEEKKLKDLKEGKGLPKGDLAQHLVVKEYFKKYKGMTDEDAKRAANYLLGRSMVDADITNTATEVVGEMYGHAPDFGDRTWNWWTNLASFSGSAEGKSKTITYQVAQASGVPTHKTSFAKENLGVQPKYDVYWHKASYPALIAAYFAMKRLYEGNGPKGIRLQQTKHVQEQMKEITKVLLEKHMTGILKDYGPSSPDEVEEIKKAPTKSEQIKLLAGLLEGTEPGQYTHKVDHIIQRADSRMNFWRRKATPFVFWKAPKTVVVGTAKTGYKAVKGVYYDAPKWAITKTYNNVAKPVIDVVKPRAKNTAIGAAIGTFIMPGLGTAVGAGIGALWKPKAAGGGGGHDHGHGGGHH